MPDLEWETVELHVQERVAWITLNRPEALNALTRQLGQDLLAVLDHVAAEPDVRAIVLTGAGRGFSSGADLKAGVWDAQDGKTDLGSPLRELFHPLILGCGGSRSRSSRP